MKKITVIGRGLDPGKHLSIEALRSLKQANLVLGIEPEKNTWQKLQLEFALPAIQDLSFLYKNGAKDSDNYNDFIDYILMVSKDHANIVLLVAGHPRLGVTFAQLLSRRKPTETELHFIEGISSFDVMLNDLELDPLEQGTSILDVNRLLLFQYKLEPSLNYFLYHICSVGTDKVHYLDAAQDNNLSLLQSYLQKYFDSNKTLYFCKASNGLLHRGEYKAVQLKDLSCNLHQVDFGTTLFVPADRPTQINFDFLQMLRGAP